MSLSYKIHHSKDATFTTLNVNPRNHLFNIIPEPLHRVVIKFQRLRTSRARFGRIGRNINLYSMRFTPKFFGSINFSCRTFSCRFLCLRAFHHILCHSLRLLRQ